MVQDDEEVRNSK